jgi:hypothetical protein
LCALSATLLISVRNTLAATLSFSLLRQCSIEARYRGLVDFNAKARSTLGLLLRKLVRVLYDAESLGALCTLASLFVYSRGR